MEQSRIVMEQTKQMLEYLKKIENIYASQAQTGKEADFYGEVKPFVDEAHTIAERWCEMATEWVRKEKPRNLFPQQIDACKENFKEISVQAFYPATDYRRFKHYVNSTHYILEKLHSELYSLKQEDTE